MSDRTPTVSLTEARTTTRRLAWAVAAAAVLQVVAPAVTILGPGTSPGGGSGPELFITPVGWAFAIWGPIYLLAIAQAVASLVRGGTETPPQLQVAQLTLYLAGTAWIAMAALDSSTATALALAVMLGAATRGVVVAARTPIGPRWLAVLTRTAIGLYAGWVTAAFFLNVSTAMVDAGIVAADDLGWQVVVLAVAVVVLLAMLVAARGEAAYAAAGVWALVGIAVTGADAGRTPLIVVPLVAAGLLVATALVVRRAPRRSPG